MAGILKPARVKEEIMKLKRPLILTLVSAFILACSWLSGLSPTASAPIAPTPTKSVSIESNDRIVGFYSLAVNPEKLFPGVGEPLLITWNCILNPAPADAVVTVLVNGEQFGEKHSCFSSDTERQVTLKLQRGDIVKLGLEIPSLKVKSDYETGIVVK
jgi:hypothetical protein